MTKRLCLFAVGSILGGRMGDLYAALGEINRTEGEPKLAVRHMRNAVEKFETMGKASDCLRMCTSV